LVLGLDYVEQLYAPAGVLHASSGVKQRAIHLRGLINDHQELARMAVLKCASLLRHVSGCHGDGLAAIRKTKILEVSSAPAGEALGKSQVLRIEAYVGK
jgi:hypothetical protein